jgi:hypothetical protein
MKCNMEQYDDSGSPRINAQSFVYLRFSLHADYSQETQIPTDKDRIESSPWEYQVPFGVIRVPILPIKQARWPKGRSKRAELNETTHRRSVRDP